MHCRKDWWIQIGIRSYHSSVLLWFTESIYSCAIQYHHYFWYLKIEHIIAIDLKKGTGNFLWNTISNINWWHSNLCFKQTRILDSNGWWGKIGWIGKIRLIVYLKERFFRPKSPILNYIFNGLITYSLWKCTSRRKR